MGLITNADRYHGQVIKDIRDDYGNSLKDLDMCDAVVIILESGDVIRLKTDWYGQDCYISQFERGEKV